MKNYEITIGDVALLTEALTDLDQYLDKYGDIAIDDVLENISLKGIDIKPIE